MAHFSRTLLRSLIEKETALVVSQCFRRRICTFSLFFRPIPFLLYMAFVHFARLFFKRVTKFVSFLVRHQDNFHWGWHLCACVYAYLFHSFSLILFIYIRLFLSSLAINYLWIHEMSASLIYICNQFKLGL